MIKRGTRSSHFLVRPTLVTDISISSRVLDGELAGETTYPAAAFLVNDLSGSPRSGATSSAHITRMLRVRLWHHN